MVIEPIARDDRAPVFDEAVIQNLQSSLRGSMIRQGDSDYDTARTIYNAMIDKRPALIVQCTNVADVMNAVNFSRMNGLTVAVRGGGHNVAGLSLIDNGLVIDLSRMRGIRVDPERRTVRVEGGTTWGELDHATHAFGLAVPSGIISTTGVAGLTLGGGFGHLSRHYGLSCDNLISADMVTADGQFHTVSAEQHPDLFWAIRGGGGNFGIVTSFEFKLHPVDTVLAGPVFYDVERTEDLMRAYRDYMRQAPNEMTAFFGFHLAPPAPFIPEHMHLKPVVIVVACYSGDMDKAEAMVKPLRELEEPLLDLVSPMPYPMINALFDDLYPPGLHHYWKADYVPELTDEAIKVHAEHGPKVTSVQSGMHLYPQTGAIQQVGKNDTAYSHRDVEFVHNIIAIDADPTKMDGNMAWMRSYYEALRPHSAAGTYVNFLMADEGQDRVRSTYQDNYDRLVEVKDKYDPDNFFSSNQNIRPSGTITIE